MAHTIHRAHSAVGESGLTDLPVEPGVTGSSGSSISNAHGTRVPYSTGQDQTGKRARDLWKPIRPQTLSRPTERVVDIHYRSWQLHLRMAPNTLMGAPRRRKQLLRAYHLQMHAGPLRDCRESGINKSGNANSSIHHIMLKCLG